jgi:hypothetical protein
MMMRNKETKVQTASTSYSHAGDLAPSLFPFIEFLSAAPAWIVLEID